MRRKQVNVCLPERYASAMVEQAGQLGTNLRSVWLAAVELLLNCPAGEREILVRFFAGRKRSALDALDPGRCAGQIEASARALLASFPNASGTRRRKPAARPARRTGD